MLTRFLTCVRHTARRFAQALGRRIAAATTPAASPLVGGTLADLVRSKPALIAENALLRQQSIILRRSVKQPRCCAGRLLHPLPLRAWERLPSHSAVCRMNEAASRPH